MIKEDKNVDFYTTGRQPSEEDFARISDWIKKDKQGKITSSKAKQITGTVNTDQVSPTSKDHS